MPALAHVRLGLPLQEDLLQLVDRQGREVHPVLSAPRKRAASGVLPLMRGAYPLYRPAALRRRRHRGGGQGAARIAGAAQRDVIKDPFDPEVIAAAKASGIPDSKIEAAQKSPVYQF